MRTGFILLMAILSCGFVVLTPEDRKELDAARKKWHRDVDKRFNQQALHAFLVKSISEIKTVEDIELSSVEHGTKFTHDRSRFCLVAGRWIFVVKDPLGNSFEMRGFAKPHGCIVLTCERLSKKTFKVTKTHLDQTLQLCPPPHTFSP